MIKIMKVDMMTLVMIAMTEMMVIIVVILIIMIRDINNNNCNNNDTCGMRSNNIDHLLSPSLIISLVHPEN